MITTVKGQIDALNRDQPELMALVYAPDAENSTVDPVVASTRAWVKAVEEKMAFETAATVASRI